MNRIDSAFSIGRLKMGRHKLLLMSLLCLLFTFVQTTALEHQHEDQNLVQVDCDLCIKLTSNDGAIATAGLDISFSGSDSLGDRQLEFAPPILAYTPRPRGPPSA